MSSVPATEPGFVKWLPIVAVAVTVAAWASAFIAIRAVGPHLSPGPLAFGRLGLGSLTLGAVMIARRKWVAPTRREWLLIGLCGFSWFAVYNVVLNAAERRIDAGTTSMLVNIAPVLIAVGAGWLLREGFPRWLLIGVAVALAGAVLIGLSTRDPGGRSVDVLGVVFCLLAALSYTVGVLAQKPALRHVPPLQFSFLACVVGAVCCLPFAPGLVREWGDAPGGAIAGLVYLAVVPMALAFTTWGYALARMNAGRLGVTTYLVPPLVIAGSALFLHETPTLLAVAGGVICLIGVGLSRRRA